MGSAVSFIAFGLQLTVSQAIVCPTQYSDIEGVCLHFPSFTKNYCGAQEYCSSVGGELVRGSNFLPLDGKNIPGMPREYWIGLTDLLNERGLNDSGWRWTDGALLPPSSGLTWWPGEPNPAAGDCVRAVVSKLAEYGCKAWRVPMCQPRSLPISGNRQRNFETDLIPVGLPVENFADGSGCSRLHTEVKSELDCAFLCVIEPQGWCVSFYFNAATQECRLVLYTDANINMGDANEWKKFVTKK